MVNLERFLHRSPTRGAGLGDLVTIEHSDPDAEVLIVTNTWPHAGEVRYGIFVKRQVDSLIELGVKCDVLFIRGFESRLAYLVAARKLRRLSRDSKYLLLHGHGGETLIPSLLFTQGPRLISFCGDDLLGSPRFDGSLTWISRIRASILRRLTYLTTATITKSREMHDVLPNRTRPRNTVLPNGVDREFFSPIDRDEARAKLGWPRDEPIALFAADPKLPRKRYPLAVAACEEARREGVPVRLEVANTLAPPTMPTVMSAVDCLLLTSAVEGSPNVVKEAVMCNLPVVTTRVGDVSEVLYGVTPSSICDDTPEALGAALAECLTRRMRSDGRERSAWLGSDEIAARLVEQYGALGVSDRAAHDRAHAAAAPQ